MDIPYKPGKLKTNRISFFVPLKGENEVNPVVNLLEPSNQKNPRIVSDTWDTASSGVQNRSQYIGKGGSNWS